MTPDELAACTYVSLTTFRRDGSASAVPIWIAALGGSTAGFTTERSSLKVTRVLHDPRVLVQPCDVRGNVDRDHLPVEGRARIVLDDDAAPVRRAISQKYGWKMRLFETTAKARDTIRRRTVERCGVVIEFDE